MAGDRNANARESEYYPNMAAVATMNVSVPDPIKDWVEAQACRGRYANASDYVRDLIRQDQDQLTKIAELHSEVYRRACAPENRSPIALHARNVVRLRRRCSGWS